MISQFSSILFPSWPRELSLTSDRSLSVYHPGDAKLIDAHAKSRRPEGLRKRHRHVSILGQSVEDELALSFVLHMDRYIKSGGPLVTIRRRVSAQQHLIADAERSVHDPFVRFSRKLIGAGHFTPGHDESDLAAQNLLVKLECFLTLSVEIQIWIDMHDALLLSVIST